MGNLQAGSIAGEIRGKVGGLIFSRNASGSYVKAYAKPVNPNTVPQNIARGHFASAVSGWSALESYQQSVWKDYADANTSFDSGVNAFVSLNTVLANAIANEYGTIVCTPAGLPVYGNFSYITMPPTTEFIPPFMMSLDQIDIVDLGAGVSGEINFNLTPGPPLPGGPEIAGFTPCAMAVYMSAPSGKKGKFVKQDIITLGNSSLLEGFTSDPTDALTLKYEALKDLELARNKPTTGQFVTVNVYWLDMFGRKHFITGSEVQVQ